MGSGQLRVHIHKYTQRRREGGGPSGVFSSTILVSI